LKISLLKRALLPDQGEIKMKKLFVSMLLLSAFSFVGIAEAKKPTPEEQAQKKQDQETRKKCQQDFVAAKKADKTVKRNDFVGRCVEAAKQNPAPTPVPVQQTPTRR
jgi:hypothetical protein